MPVLNVVDVTIYFRIPKCLLYIFKDNRHERKINLVPQREDIEQVYYGFSFMGS